MRLRACIALLPVLSACATSAPSPRALVARNPRSANLQRAAELPWSDEGRCVVQESSQPCPVLVERCFHALDHERVRFRDPTGRCGVASAGAATAVGVGICVLAAPEIVVGAVIIAGVVVVGVALKEALEDEYRLRQRYSEEAGPVAEAKPVSEESVPMRMRKPESSPNSQDWFPPVPPESLDQERRRDCTPRPVPHLGGNVLHNQCADGVPQNGFPGWDVLVNGKNFDTYTVALQKIVIEKQVSELQRDLARACGYDFVVGVRSEAHRKALRDADPSLNIVVMDWC